MSNQVVLQSLRKAIEIDRNYFIKAKIDEKLNTIRSQVNRLLEEIQQEAKTKAEHEISNAEPMVKRMENWFKNYSSNETARSKYASVCDMIQEAKRRFGRHSYFDYLDVLDIMDNVGKDLNLLHKSIRDDSDNIRKDLENYKERLNKYNNVLDEIHSNNRIFCITLILIIIGIILFYNGNTGIEDRGGDSSGMLALLIICSIPFLGILFMILIGYAILVGEFPGEPSYMPSFLVGFLGILLISGSLQGFFLRRNRESNKSIGNQEQTEKEIEFLKKRISISEKSIFELNLLLEEI